LLAFVICFSFVACGGKAQGDTVFGKEVIVEDVMNGPKTQVIGKSAYISITPEEFQSMTDEQLTEICNAVKEMDYNWFTVDCGDGTGIVFPGCKPVGAIYCQLSDGRGAGETIKLVWPTENGYTWEDLDE